MCLKMMGNSEKESGSNPMGKWRCVDVVPRPRQDPPKDFSHLGGERLEASSACRVSFARMDPIVILLIVFTKGGFLK